MADEITNKLLRFALLNSNLPKVVTEPDDIENEIARNLHKLSLSDTNGESNAGKKLFEITAKAGNKTSVAIIESKSDCARSKAKKRLALNQKQKEKEVVKECWSAWQSKPEQYKNNTTFATVLTRV